MDIIDYFLQSHRALRRELAALEAPFARPHGIGWDDCVSLDRKALLRDIDAFFASFREHEADEDEFLSEVAGRVRLDKPTLDAFSESRRAVAEIMKLFAAVAFTCDGEHVHRVRELLSRVHQEIEAHLDYEEKTMFPLIRRRLAPALLKRLGERARERPFHGSSRG